MSLRLPRLILQKLFRPVIVPKPVTPVLQRQSERRRGHKKNQVYVFDFDRINTTHYISYQFSPFRFMDTMDDKSFLPPEQVRGMKQLDKSLFDSTVDVPSVIVNSQQISQILKVINKYLLRLPNLKAVVDLNSNDTDFKTKKIIMLDPKLLNSMKDIDDHDKQKLQEQGIVLDIVNHKLKLSYNNWNFADIMKAILPEDSEGVSGFEEIGHIAHFNLRDASLPYKNILGTLNMTCL